MRRGKKGAGINFLVDSSIAEEIVRSVDSRGKDVLEIGPGRGSLTTFILNYKTLTLIEREKSFSHDLKLKFPNAVVITGDALKIEWPRFQVFVSNMPYSISSPLLEKLWNSEFEEGIVTVQREVADRIIASPGSKNFSKLSVMMQLKFKIEKKIDISPDKFKPVPEVYSTVLKLIKRDAAIPGGVDIFLQNLFSQRRKKLRNILPHPLYPDKRPEELKIEELLELFENISEKQ